MNALHKAPRSEMRALTRFEGERLRNTNYTTIYEGGVAVLQINGPVFRRADTMETSGAMSTESIYHELKTSRASQNVKSLLIDFDTPGGDAINGGTIAKFIRAMAEEKRVESFGSGYCASLGYLWASATSRITLNEWGEMGSIGCVIGAPIPQGKTEFGDNILIDADGTAWAEIVSSISPLKRPDVRSKEGHQYYLNKVNHHADTFVQYVSNFRNLDASRVPAQYGNGGTWPDTEALDMGICDEIGTLDSVLERMMAGDWERGSSMTGSSGASEQPPEPPALPAPEGGETPEVAQENDGGEDVALRDYMPGSGDKGKKGAGASAGGEDTLPISEVLAHLATTRPEVEASLEKPAVDKIRAALVGDRKAFLASQHQFAGLVHVALVDDKLFGGKVSYINAEGEDVQGTRAEMVEALLESLPVESLADERVRSVQEGDVKGSVLKDKVDEKTTVPEPGEFGNDNITREQALGASSAGQAVLAAEKKGQNGNGAGA